MSSVSAEFVEQSVIGVLDKLVERRNVWLTEATTFAAAEERVDAMTVRRRDEAAPCCADVQQLATTTDQKTVCRPVRQSGRDDGTSRAARTVTAKSNSR